MKRNHFSALAVAAAALVLIGAGRGGGGGFGGVGGGGGHGGGGAHFAAPSAARGGGAVVYRQQRVSVPRASMPSPQNVVRDQGRAAFPRNNEVGAPITQRASAIPPAHHATVARNSNVVRNIQAQQRNEVVPNHYYWHNDNGMRYSHYFDGHNHWYGFYHGPTFYWTRYQGDRWWWYDRLRARWDFWWDGYWWWPGTGGAAYVYVDNNYYPYNDADAGVTVEHVQEQPVPSALPEPGSGKEVDSPDKTRMVQLGSDGQAFLFDMTKTPPTFMKYLGQGVTNVRFSGGTASAPLQILVEYSDNTFSLFDADGTSLSSSVQAEESTTPAPPETPDSIPPPPTSAPGQ